MKTKPVCKTVYEFIAAHLGKEAAGALTGQDRHALEAFRHLVELYACGDTLGRACAIEGMRACVAACQPSCHGMLRKAIPAGLDWSDEHRLWAEITDSTPGVRPDDGRVTRS